MSSNRPWAKIVSSPLLIISLLLFARSLTMAESLDDRTNKIAHKLRCPTCQAMSVKESDAGFSNNMKLKIREMLKEGKSEKEILKFFEERYGEWILRMPGKKGFNLLLWTLPGVVVSLAIIILFVSLMKNKRRKSLVEGEPEPISAEEESRVERGLRNINQ